MAEEKKTGTGSKSTTNKPETSVRRDGAMIHSVKPKSPTNQRPEKQNGGDLHF